jgi:hypothetical protein
LAIFAPSAAQTLQNGWFRRSVQTFITVQAIVEIFFFYHPVKAVATERRLKSLTVE